MNNMKAIKYITGLMFMFSVASWSCSDDWLDLHPISNINEGDFYKTKEDFQSALIAAYATLYTEFGPYRGPSYSEQLSDEAIMYDATAPTADKMAWQNYGLQPANSIVQSIYRETYGSLYTVNMALTKLSDASFDGKAEMEGELRLLRGMLYFNLVRLFGDIPLVKKPLSVSESYDLLRTPTADVYKSIITDMRFAAENLPLRSQIARTGQLTKGAAQGMLGKVYLTVNNKDSAAYFLNQVRLSNEYGLLDNYADLFGMRGIGNKNSKEALIEIQYVGAANSPNSDYLEAFGPYQNMILSGQGMGMNQVSDDLWNEFETGDPRREASIFEGYTNRAENWVDIKFPAKWYDDVFLTTANGWYKNNFIVLRYSDILLMLAEAANDASYLNIVRSRAGLPSFGDPAYPAEYNTLALAIEHERVVELSLEFHRWFDLKRTGRATTVLTAKKGKPITENMLVLPIPLGEIEINPKLEQNDYYR